MRTSLKNQATAAVKEEIRETLAKIHAKTNPYIKKPLTDEQLKRAIRATMAEYV